MSINKGFLRSCTNSLTIECIKVLEKPWGVRSKDVCREEDREEELGVLLLSTVTLAYVAVEMLSS